MEENVKVNISHSRIKVASYALARTINALNNYGIHDITVTMEDDNLVVVFDVFEHFRYQKPNNNENSDCSGSVKCNGHKR